jgi:hypothetical protein
MIVPPRRALARDRVRHIGDPVAFVIADTAEQVRDPAEQVDVRHRPLPAVVDAREALAGRAPMLWDEAPGNLSYLFERGDKQGYLQLSTSHTSSARPARGAGGRGRDPVRTRGQPLFCRPAGRRPTPTSSNTVIGNDATSWWVLGAIAFRFIGFETKGRTFEEMDNTVGRRAAASP